MRLCGMPCVHHRDGNSGMETPFPCYCRNKKNDGH